MGKTAAGDSREGCVEQEADGSWVKGADAGAGEKETPGLATTAQSIRASGQSLGRT